MCAYNNCPDIFSDNNFYIAKPVDMCLTQSAINEQQELGNLCFQYLNFEWFVWFKLVLSSQSSCSFIFLAQIMRSIFQLTSRSLFLSLSPQCTSERLKDTLCLKYLILYINKIKINSTQSMHTLMFVICNWNLDTYMLIHMLFKRTNKDLKMLLLYCTDASLALFWNVLKENIRIEYTQIVSDCYK